MWGTGRSSNGKCAVSQYRAIIRPWPHCAFPLWCLSACISRCMLPIACLPSSHTVLWPFENLISWSLKARDHNCSSHGRRKGRMQRGNRKARENTFTQSMPVCTRKLVCLFRALRPALLSPPASYLICLCTVLCDKIQITPFSQCFF